MVASIIVVVTLLLKEAWLMFISMKHVLADCPIDFTFRDAIFLLLPQEAFFIHVCSPPHGRYALMCSLSLEVIANLS